METLNFKVCFNKNKLEEVAKAMGIDPIDVVQWIMADFDVLHIEEMK